jgi:hypothetical protein
MQTAPLFGRGRVAKEVKLLCLENKIAKVAEALFSCVLSCI